MPAQVLWGRTKSRRGDSNIGLYGLLMSLAGRRDDSPFEHRAEPPLPPSLLLPFGCRARIACPLAVVCAAFVCGMGRSIAELASKSSYFSRFGYFFASILYLLLCAGAKKPLAAGLLPQNGHKKARVVAGLGGDGLALISQEQRQCVAFFGEGPVH